MKKFYLDTNIVVRLLTDKDTLQYQQAKTIFKNIEAGNKTVYLSILVVNEIIWILEHYYKLKRELFVPKIRQLFSLKNIKLLEIKKNVLTLLLIKYQQTKFDFTDLYLSEMAEKTGIVLSFDRDFEKLKTKTSLVY